MRRSWKPSESTRTKAKKPDSAVLVVWTLNGIAKGTQEVRNTAWADAMRLLPEFVKWVRAWPWSFVLLAGPSTTWGKVKAPTEFDGRAAEVHHRLQSAGVIASRGVGLYETMTMADDRWHVVDAEMNLERWAEWLVDLRAF